MSGEAIGGLIQRILSSREGKDKRTDAPNHPDTVAPSQKTATDVEAGLPDQITQGRSPARRPTVHNPDEGYLIPREDKLLVFRSLAGIATVPALTQAGHSTRSANNVGIYTRVVKAETAAKRGFRFYSKIINVFLGVQIIVAAILTALGAANGPHSAVTAFGAINTIIAGAMTYLKGSGLPNMLKHHESEWRVVREYIEQREREFCLAGCPLDVDEEMFIVEDLYKTTKTELESSSNQGVFKSLKRDIPRSILPKPAPSTLEGPKQPEKIESSTSGTVSDKVQE